MVLEKQQSHSGGSIRRNIILITILIICSTISYTYVTTLTTKQSLLPDIDFDAPSSTQLQQQHYNEADYIIHKSYSETYARMYNCPDDIIEKECILQIVEKQNEQLQQNQNTTTTNINTNAKYQVPIDHPYPWWFQSLLRDIPTNGAYGFWHHFSTIATTPQPIKYCAIGKNGSTEWRKIFKELNAPEFCNDNDKDRYKCSKFNTATKLSDDVAKTVFIRDPLERLLSAYLDKCVKPNVRISQGHCEPNDIFGTDFLERKYKKEQLNNGVVKNKQQYQQYLQQQERYPQGITAILQDNEKEMFAAYVDLLPLKWNIHFTPQSLTCDLYRNIDNYDVYKMGTNFMNELDRMANKYGGELPRVLSDTFGYQSKLSSGSGINIGSDNNHGTKAPAKVAKYYTARAVRRALEYLSIDYIILGLEVPIWAKEMLLSDQ